MTHLMPVVILYAFYFLMSFHFQNNAMIIKDYYYHSHFTKTEVK